MIWNDVGLKTKERDEWQTRSEGCKHASGHMQRPTMCVFVGHCVGVFWVMLENFRLFSHLFLLVGPKQKIYI